MTTDKSLENSGTATTLYVDYERLPRVVKKVIEHLNIFKGIQNSNIFIDDGLISLLVEECTETDVLCTVENGGMLGNRKVN